MKFFSLGNHRRLTGLLGVGMTALLLGACAAKKEEPSDLCTTSKYKGTGSDTSIVDFEDPNIVDVTSTITNKDNLHVGFFYFGDYYEGYAVGEMDPVFTVASSGQGGSNRSMSVTYTPACVFDPATVDPTFCYFAAAVHFEGCYDASAYDGISLYVKGHATNAEVTLLSESAQGTEFADGGSCSADDCTWPLQPTAPLPETWTLFEGRFADILGGNAGSTPFPKDLASGVEVLVHPWDPADTEWEIDIDTVNFIKQ